MTAKIVYDIDTLNLMKAFENFTHAKIKDCIVDERIYFVIEPGELKQALGKSAENIKKLSEKFNKKVRVVEYDANMHTLIQRFIHPLKVDSVDEQDHIVVLHSNDTKTKGLIIGRAAKNLRALEKHIQRYFPDLKEIKVM